VRTIIAGSRNINDYGIVLKAIRDSVQLGCIRPTCIISGGARGPDMLSVRFAREFEFPVEVYNADWDKYGNRAGYLRNEEMAKVADALIAIWDGVSNGTRHMIALTKKYKVRTYVYRIKKVKIECYCHVLDGMAMGEVIKSSGVDPFGLIFSDVRCECGMIHHVVSRKSIC
jgi:hypothetical protein